jgi:hypothetical protein
MAPSAVVLFILGDPAAVQGSGITCIVRGMPPVYPPARRQNGAGSDARLAAWYRPERNNESSVAPSGGCLARVGRLFRAVGRSPGRTYLGGSPGPSDDYGQRAEVLVAGRSGTSARCRMNPIEFLVDVALEAVPDDGPGFGERPLNGPYSFAHVHRTPVLRPLHGRSASHGSDPIR